MNKPQTSALANPSRRKRSYWQQQELGVLQVPYNEFSTGDCMHRIYDEESARRFSCSRWKAEGRKGTESLL